MPSSYKPQNTARFLERNVDSTRFNKKKLCVLTEPLRQKVPNATNVFHVMYGNVVQNIITALPKLQNGAQFTWYAQFNRNERSLDPLIIDSIYFRFHNKRNTSSNALAREN